jgi:hypothetical protein
MSCVTPVASTACITGAELTTMVGDPPKPPPFSIMPRVMPALVESSTISPGCRIASSVEGTL